MTPEQFTTIRAKHFGQGDIGRVALANALGVSRRSVYRYESGECPISGPVERLMGLVEKNIDINPR